MTGSVLRLPVNAEGRDFVVGDVHGAFTVLDGLLREAGFNPRVDRLIAVGDLVDRGEDSDQVLSWLDRPWFNSVLGNHELMAIMCARGAIEPRAYSQNGGDWLMAMEPAVQLEYAQAFEKLPLAIEVATPTGRVGVIHADMPPNTSWPALLQRLELGDPDLLDHLLWSRRRVEEVAAGRPVGPIAGVDHVFVGHTPMRQMVRSDNVFYIDLGYCFGGQLMLASIDGKPVISAVHQP